MKAGIVGSGAVGSSAAYAMVMSGAASEVVRVDLNEKLARAQAAYRIIDGKGATNYGIGAGIASIVRAIRANSRTVMTLSAPAPELEYVHGACLSLPRIMGAHGIETTLHPALSEEEHEAIDHSARMLREAASTITYTEPSTAAALETQEVL
jgi:L-lactate dehydrogenase